jgi:hypothetical protein
MKSANAKFAREEVRVSEWLKSVCLAPPKHEDGMDLSPRTISQPVSKVSN